MAASEWNVVFIASYGFSFQLLNSLPYLLKVENSVPLKLTVSQFHIMYIGYLFAYISCNYVALACPIHLILFLFPLHRMPEREREEITPTDPERWLDNVILIRNSVKKYFYNDFHKVRTLHFDVFIAF